MFKKVVPLGSIALHNFKFKGISQQNKNAIFFY